MSLALTLTALGHLISGLGIGFLLPIIVGLVANLLILGLLIAPGVVGLAWFVHGLAHEAALFLWRTLLPTSYAENFEFDDESRRAIISVGVGLGLATAIIVAAK